MRYVCTVYTDYKLFKKWKMFAVFAQSYENQEELWVSLWTDKFEPEFVSKLAGLAEFKLEQSFLKGLRCLHKPVQAWKHLLFLS